MGYILFLTKHHDGFCLWDTKTTDRKVTKSPLGRDVLAAVRKSCDKYGIKLALYFSEGDWNWPGAVDGQSQKGGSNPEMKKAQLKEILTQYGPVEYIWFDHAVGTGGLSHADTIKWVKQFQPGCFVGFNHGDQEGSDIRLGEEGHPGSLEDHSAAGKHMRDAPATTYRLAEFTYPILPPHKGGAMWFYSLPMHDSLCKPAEDIFHDYLGAKNFGNIFALDVGPGYDGRIRDIDVKTLRQVGAMIRNTPPEPSVTEIKKDNGISEIRVNAPDGKELAQYTLNLSKHYAPAPASQPTDAIKQWEACKFGAFVCYNSNQFTGNEYCKITDPKLYNPTKLDVAQWIAVLKKAGMKYALLTVRHTSGFMLYDSPTTLLDVGGSGDKTDVVKEYVEACRKAGIAPGLYYCLWGGEKWLPNPQARAIILAQLNELATRYGKIPYWFIDMDYWAPKDLPMQDIYDLLKSHNPDTIVLINEHIQDGTKITAWPSDVLNGEVTMPPATGHQIVRGVQGKKYYLPFEYEPESQRRGNALAWFTYGEGRSFVPSHTRSAEELARDIRQAYQRGAANVMLACAPDHTGRFRPDDAAELIKLGGKVRQILAQPDLVRPVRGLSAAPPTEAWKVELLQKPIRAFCIDFNWHFQGNSHGFAAPGHWADADPAAHVKWYKDIGANCIQTFVLSCNGYAWYKGGPIPEQPGLKHDFLPEVVRLGHEQKMLVMGYYCVASNTLWGRKHPDQSYGTPSAMHIPLTKDYVDYLCVSIKDALKRTGIDGFMIDWLSNTSGKWLDCEKTMYAELMGVPFPGADKITPEDKARFDRLAVERCWTRIRDTARRVKPDCILWPNGLVHMRLDGVDWLLNEGPETQATENARQQLNGRPIRLIQNQVGWASHDARKVFSKSKYQAWDFYGFAAPYDNSLPLPAADYLNRPVESFNRKDRMGINDRNIAALVRFYLGKPVEPPYGFSSALSEGKAARASGVYRKGFEADKAFDGNEKTRWNAEKNARRGWLEVDLEKPTEIGQAVIHEMGFQRTQAFAIEYKDGGEWKEAVHGATIAGARAFEFKPVTARFFRLNILQADEVPTIEEFQLFAPGASLGQAMEQEKQREARIQWFREAKFGFFINWGLYSIPAGEWKGKFYPGIGEWIMHQAKIPVKEYEQLARQFNPVKFNAEEWVQLAEDAGTKYLVFDVKHHDGFALYHSKVNKYNVTDATPWGRDPLKELEEACQRHGIKLCFYYSQATDWHEPNGANNEWDFAPNAKKDFDQYLRDKSLPQVKELLTNYGPIGLIWFDVPTLMNPERSQRFVDLVRAIQPDCLINGRLGPIATDYQSRGDNEIPGAVVGGDWETPATINDTWGYKKDDHNWKSTDDLVFKLVDIVSKGGNYLLNVGPDAEGEIPAPSAERLRAMGKWLKVNGEAIYGAGRTPFGKEVGDPIPGKKDRRGHQVYNLKKDWRCTTKPGKLYIHLFTWPQGGTFELGGVQGKKIKAYFLCDPEHKGLAIAQEGDKVTISSLPDKAPGEIATVLCLDVVE